MAGYRQLHTRMWSSDRWFADLRPEFKLLFIYLFSNERASVCGLYELPLRVICFETGLEREIVVSGFDEFKQADKVLYDMETGVVFVRNMFKYQGSGSPKIKERIKADLKAVPDCELKKMWVEVNRVLIGYQDGKDTSLSVSISSSSSESEGREGVGEEPITIPDTPAEAMKNPDILVYKAISGRIPGQRDYRVVIETIQALREKHGDDLQAYLLPFWTAWSTRKTKDHRPYSPTSLVWLCEWALQNNIPRTNRHEPRPGENTSVNDAIKKVVQNAKK